MFCSKEPCCAKCLVTLVLDFLIWDRNFTCLSLIVTKGICSFCWFLSYILVRARSPSRVSTFQTEFYYIAKTGSNLQQSSCLSPLEWRITVKAHWNWLHLKIERCLFSLKVSWNGYNLYFFMITHFNCQKFVNEETVSRFILF